MAEQSSLEGGSSGGRAEALADARTEDQHAAGKRWWWLGEVGPYGYSKPIDGPHEDRAGVEEAAYLMARLGLQRDRQFSCLEITETPVQAVAHGANEGALSTLNSIGLCP